MLPEKRPSKYGAFFFPSVRFEFTNFPTVNFNALNEFGVVVNTDFTTGSHHVRIKEVRFVK